MQLLVWTFKSTPDIEIGENIVSQGKKTKQQHSMVVGTKLWTTVTYPFLFHPHDGSFTYYSRP